MSSPCQDTMQSSNPIQVRFVIMFLLFLAAFVIDVTRSNLNIAIVTMTQPIPIEPNLDVCPHPPKYDAEIQFFQTGNFTHGIEHHEIPFKFNRRQYPWDQEMQGLVLGSFFWAMMIFHTPAGALAQRIGGVYIVSACLFGSSILSFLTPYITDFHVFVFIGLRFALGMLQAGHFSAGFGMICNWMPMRERPICFAILEAASYIGSVLMFWCSGYLSLHFGWPMLFYVPGVMASTVFILFALTATSEPKDHPRISVEELTFIMSDKMEEMGLNQKEEESQQQETPWVAILTNRAVHAATLIKFSIGWNYAVFYLEMPKYLNEIIHQDIRSNGTTNAGVNLLTAVIMTLTGCLSEKIIEHGYLCRTTCRKVFACFSCLGYGLCMLLIPVVGCDAFKLRCIMFTCATLAGFQGGSDLPLASEMSKNYPATIYAVVNNVALAAGFIVPTYAGIILSDIKDQWFGWCIVFYSSCALSVVSFVVFLFCASSERQEFDLSPEEKMAKELAYDAKNFRLPVHRGWYLD